MTTPPTAPPTAPAPVPAAALPPPPAPPADRLLLSSSDAPARPALLFAALAVGVGAGLLLPFRDVGLALTLCLLAGGAVVLAAGRRRRSGFSMTCGALAVLCALVPTLRAAEWLTVLCLLVAGVLILVGTTHARSLFDLVLGGIVAAFTPVTGLPWLGRSIAAVRGATNSVPVLRTVALSAAVLVVFGALLASGDAVLGSWIDDLVPDLGSADLVLRIFVGCAAFGCVLVAALLALDPPRFPEMGPTRAVERRYEWLAPILVIDGLYVAFLAAQAAAFFGGDAYLRDTTGLTYAEYVHQGFGQLTVATVFTLVVIGLAAPRASRTSEVDRRWLRGAVGLLCLLTLSVVASALHRMGLYQDAYGLTVLRLLVIVFEAWLGVLVVMVMVAGIRLRGDWLVRAGILSGAAAILALAAVNPEGLVARHNLDRAAAGERLDRDYLAGLSADAVPAILDADRPDADCLLPRVEDDDDALEWNWGRARARQLLEDAGADAARDERAGSVPCGVLGD